MSRNVKITTILNPLALLAPHSCRGCGSLGSPLCECCKNNNIKTHENFCPHCKAKNPSGNCPNCPDLPPTFVFDLRQNLVGSLIHDYKYHSVRALARPLAEFLDATLPNNLPNNTVIVPLPSSTAHIRARAFDHILLIAKHLSKLRGLKISRPLLRAKNTVQVGADGATRRRQALSAYKVSPETILDPDTTYLLIDDVWTTGASITSAIKKLREAGAKNFIVAVLATNGLN